MCDDDRWPFAEHVMTDLLAKIGRHANVWQRVAVILLHAFCSDRAMKGAATRAIQELAGHRDLTTRRSTCV